MWRKFNKPLLAKIRRASREYGLIQPYDKIAVGLSGGKDSTVLLYALSVLQKTLPFPFELHGISLDVGWNNNYEIVGEYCRSLGAVSYTHLTRYGIIFHSGDFKFDQTPVDGKGIDYQRIAELGNKGVLAFLSDSTNVERPGYSTSERSVGENFDNIFRSARERIVVATLAPVEMAAACLLYTSGHAVVMLAGGDGYPVGSAVDGSLCRSV